MSSTKITLALFLALPLSLLPALSLGSGEGGLVEKMAKLQYFMHKAGLAIKAQNKPLTGFYVHEVEETIEELQEFGQYKKHKIGELVEEILVPSFEQLEKQVKHGDADAQWKAYTDVINSCNRCHRSTAHGFIKIDFSDTSPYLQSFGK